MGTGYDCFDTRSYTNDQRIPKPARANRATLMRLMAADFVNYDHEWWHYRLKEELTRRVNASISPNRINAVLFKEIVVQ